MCNAHNHRKYCRCGWGHPGVLSYSISYPQGELISLRSFASAHSDKKSSITQPNYKCKCCNQRVYFFQASNGGKVLFDSLGKPWPVHDCLGIQYKRRKSNLKIPKDEWLQLQNCSIIPGCHISSSKFTGLIVEPSNKQFEICISVVFDDPLLIRDLYLNIFNYLVSDADIEVLIILDDGRHFFSSCRVAHKTPFIMENLIYKKPYTQQTKLI